MHYINGSIHGIKPYVDRIKEHKDFLEKQWFEILSPEEQGKYLQKKKESHRNAMQAPNFMLAFNAVYGDYYK